jgi:hypothetical protein
MSTTVLVVIVVLVVVAVAALVAVGAMMMRERQRSSRLRQQFGPEYQRTLERRGSRSQAEQELAERQERRGKLQVRDLEPASRDAYVARWQATQARFVDYPAEAVAEADRLIAEVMSERGYPVEDFERRADDVSVDHPAVVADYRSAHAISRASNEGRADTEDYRIAMVHFRSLFDELLGHGQAARPSDSSRR